ncbi:PIR protein [Plasmodium yoelii]|uniref:PIR protein n=2 Tax=Plasmodium yoelii TaxID=5861 RepID=A0AAE9WK49_PLAYO|nr:PIR protein [Plasmodium yoelii]WBY54396.1 PIR protein [Plasmodium yoelii yoelii]CDU16000.1 YIR protein [Plasmodium yoelii]VTZ71415.1 PIR protein [Plasmodium yoelii]|eukprot:XP_022811025.1 PIR protein [Plasmodium yoelii]
MVSNVCGIINTVDKYVVDDPNNPGEYHSTHLLKVAFPKNDCSNDDRKLSSFFIALLSLLNDNNKNENLAGDKLVEYAILWLSYKLNQKKENGTIILNDFYNNIVVTNSCYYQKINANSDSDNKISKDVIKKKIESMDIDIKDISNFYDAFKSLCNMYNEIVADDDQCNKCLKSAGELFEKYEKLKNALDVNKGSSYYQLLSSLSNDYKIFENKYSDKCSNISLVACPRSSVTKNILITIAIIFVAASIFLGIAYKYSLLGFRNRFQKQKLREKLKK